MTKFTSPILLFSPDFIRLKDMSVLYIPRTIANNSRWLNLNSVLIHFGFSLHFLARAVAKALGSSLSSFFWSLKNPLGRKH